MLPIFAPTPENLRAAAAALRAGRLVGMPTETVYGLAGNALDPAALARIFEAKRRPFFDPLIVHVDDPAQVETLCRDIPAAARLLMQCFWPGPLTLALKRTALVPDLATAGLPTVAVRMPAHPVARALIRAAGVPLAAPSANPFGALSPTTPAHVAAAFANEPVAEFPEGLIHGVLDGGPCAVGVESSVVGWIGDEPVLWRAGGVSLEALEAALGKRPLLPDEIRNDGTENGGGGDDHGVPASPGALPWHYAPRTPLRLSGDAARPAAAGARVGLLVFGNTAAADAAGEERGGYAAIENLSPSGDLREAAANLFAALHRLDALGLDVIHARPVPDEGLGRAINERLRKAAAAPENR